MALTPHTLLAGLEIRNQVHDFTHSRILALRAQRSPSSTTNAKYQNISSLRANTMKFLPNLFPRASLTRLFLCFPDPHFKARKHKARIVSPTLVAEYAYVMRPGGCVYIITDVRDLYDWIRACFDGTATEQDVNDDATQQQQQQRPREVDVRSELWEEVPEEERERDVCMRAVREETEEGRKVQRNGGDKFAACWRRRRDPDWPLDILVED
ncbi:tRNA (guanine-N(7)-)-methyltransferase (tRNA(m7G46)-methyltransferase) [Lobaria immixta]|nr:tRNA (guanine-N(7)-)-methyltransferase (tRNA(m7G46)-methyltransferase) [Lobaria immixta]